MVFSLNGCEYFQIKFISKLLKQKYNVAVKYSNKKQNKFMKNVCRLLKFIYIILKVKLVMKKYIYYYKKKQRNFFFLYYN